jgi:hypothetical protein
MELAGRLHRIGTCPTLGVRTELLERPRLGMGAQQERLPFDRDKITGLFLQPVEADRRDIAPRSEEVGPDGQGDTPRVVDLRHRRYFTATGCTGEPTAFVNGSGDASRKKA